MSHFAKIENTIVTEVIVAEQDFINSGAVGDSFLWVQTSYTNSFRKNYAGVGYTYDSVRDAFIAPKPFPSFILNEATCRWEAPVAYPTEVITVDSEGIADKAFTWDEDTTSWVEVV